MIVKSRFHLLCRRFATTAAKSKKIKEKLVDIDDNNIVKNDEIYERKTPLEHVLLRPGMYIGEVETKSAETWVYNQECNRMEKELLTYSPAMIKVSLHTYMTHLNKNIILSYIIVLVLLDLR